jgi:hypothetical protein
MWILRKDIALPVAILLAIVYGGPGDRWENAETFRKTRDIALLEVEASRRRREDRNARKREPKFTHRGDMPKLGSAGKG